MYNETYSTDPKIGYAGMVADMTNATIISRTAEAEIGFGAPVARATEAHKTRPVTTGDTVVLGFSVRSQATAAESVDKYPAKDTAAVMVKGSMLVTVAEAVAVGDPVSVVVATGAIGVTGVAVVGATFESAAGTGELAKILIV